MFSPAGVVTYAYGPQAAGCVPYWMVAATAATSAATAGGRAQLIGGQVPGGVQPESPTRIPAGTNSPYPPSAAAYHDILKRTVQLNDLLYPSVIPLPGTLTAENSSSSSAARSGTQQGLRAKEDTVRAPHEPSLQRAGHDQRSPGLSPLHHGYPLSPTAVKSKDLKFGIDRILHPSRSNEDSSKGEPQKPGSPDANNSSVVRRPIAKNPGHPSPVLTPPRSSYCSPVYRSPEASLGRSLSPGRGCHRPGVMAPHPSHIALNQRGHQSHQLMAQSMAAAAGYHHHFRPEYTGHLSMMGHSAHQIQASQQHHQEQSHPKRKRSWSRAVFSHLQRKGLEKRFEVQKYVTKPDRRQLAAMLGLTDAQVKVWFQNRRMKWRHAEEAKRKKEEEDKQNKTQTSSVMKTTEKIANIHNTSSDTSEVLMKCDDENDSDDERDNFEYSFDEEGHNDELIVDEVSSDEDDEQSMHSMKYVPPDRHNKLNSPQTNKHESE